MQESWCPESVKDFIFHKQLFWSFYFENWIISPDIKKFVNKPSAIPLKAAVDVGEK